MGEFAIGQGVPRFEDPRLLRGGGKYVDDITLPGMAFGHVLRSPHAHARIKSIDISKAKAAPGVLAVLTGDDWIKSGWGDLPVPVTHKRRDGSPNYKPRYPALVKDRVRFVGDYVAFVVAETKNQAMDACELIEVDYEVLPAAIGTAAAAKPGAPLVWEDCKDNVCFTAIHGDKAKTEAAFKNAAHVVKQHLVINRVTTASMEPRGSLGDYNAITDSYTIYTTLQRAHPYRAELAKLILKVPEHKVRVIAPDIGGSFGMKSAVYNEVPLVLLGSKITGRPVKWMSTRSEAFLSDAQAHRRGAGARQGRHVPRLPRVLDGEHRCLSANGLPGLHRQPRHAGRRLPHAGDVRGIDRGVLAHPADAAVSRQRTAGGRLRDRAHGRHGGERARR
jgi:carbon-monoxide dehydrogenase large subunit